MALAHLAISPPTHHHLILISAGGGPYTSWSPESQTFAGCRCSVATMSIIGGSTNATNNIPNNGL